MKRIKVIQVLLYVFLVFGALGQEVTPPVNIQSPNAASLGKYGDVPVSYFTGTPNINIPIRSLKVRGIELTIGLNYDASGVRVNDHPGWVGQNWSLLAGGLIVRTVNESPDENSFANSGSFFEGTGYDNGYMYRCSDLNEVDLSDSDKLKDFYAERHIRYGYDYQPDIFTFNFMGKTGKFFLGEDGNWKVSSKSNLKVVMKPDLITPLFKGLGSDLFDGDFKYPKVIGGFELIDDQGTTYTFGYDTTAIEYSISFFHQIIGGPGIWMANAWYLTRVTDKYGNELYRFKYERDHFIARFYRNIKKQWFSLDSHCGWFDFTCLNPSASYFQATDATNVAGNLISPVYLSDITTINGDRIDFVRSRTQEMTYSYSDIKSTYDRLRGIGSYTSYFWIYYLQQANPYIDEPRGDDFLDNLAWQKLDCIIIAAGHSGAFPDKVSFEYGNNADERLCLKNVDFLSNDWMFNPNMDTLSYSFFYDSFNSIPKYLSRKVDHWGFNNGQAYDLDSINLVYNHYQQREPNPDYTSIGVLNKIVYPTGGWTSFEYEPNTYSHIVSNNRASSYSESGIGGGLRIKEIMNYDGKTNETREFIYAKKFNNSATNIVSSGILTGKPKYLWNDFHLHWNYLQPVDYYANTFSNNSLIPLANSFGPTVGYSEVAEKRNDGNYIIYKYSNYDTKYEFSTTDTTDYFLNNFYFDQAPINTFQVDASIDEPFSGLGALRGNILNKTYYNNKNNKVLSKKYIYRTDRSQIKNDYVLSTNVSGTVSPSMPIIIYHGNAYKLFYFDYDVAEKDVTHFFDQDSLVEKTFYSKEDINLPDSKIRLLKMKSIINSKGDTIKTTYIYPTDIPNAAFMQNLENENRYGEIVQTKWTNNNTPVGFTSRQYIPYNGLIVPDLVKYAKTDENGQFNITYYDAYDNAGNLLQYHKSNGTPISYIWGYGLALPIAKIVGATYSQMESALAGSPYYTSSAALQALSDEDVDAVTEATLRSGLDKIRKALPDAMVTTYTYNPLIGVTSITDPRGETTSYVYDNFGRLYQILDNNGKVLKQYGYHYANQ